MNADPGALLREGMLMLASVGGPLFLVVLLAGLVLGIVQAATQINDAAVGFIPRMVIAVGIVWFTGPWMMERLAAFFTSAVTRMAGP